MQLPAFDILQLQLYPPFSLLFSQFLSIVLDVL
jgi:hypothetical protein